ncbi:MAG: 5-(carboxyamino)imidazole ribonucleotide synthase [Chitinispirillales bacterium]|jgi:5-(carboxyamino)imidazole ribonucleotide synthase|nr:5-(carboxyamino)imidazole ribonucleotide synthase [Chitinispirillales bacterium]
MRIGILGGGQLARMLALGGHPLGATFVILDPVHDACASAVARHITGDYTDQEKLKQFAGMIDIVTYEFENVPAEAVEYLATKLPVYPPVHALAMSRDRLYEKSLFRDLGIPTPKFFNVTSLDELRQAAKEVGLPAVLKSRTLGYDGKGQAVIRSMDELENAWSSRLAGVDCILEAFVNFKREISVVAVRSRAGEIIFYPVGENVHSEGILRHSVCSLNDPMQKLAEDYITRLLNNFDYVGVMALELFDTGGELMANEIAPRVHNTGHWTIEGAQTSQFENHIRAIMGLPLGGTSPIGHCAMINFIGTIPPPAPVLEIKGAHYHNYGKAPVPGRKLGHVTVCGENQKEVKAGMKKVLALIAG